MPPCQSHYCDRLPSSSITRLLRNSRSHPTPCFAFAFLTCYRLSGILTSLQDKTGSPGLPYILNLQHAMLSDPGVACATRLLSLHSLLASRIANPSPYPILSISRLNHFSLRLRPVGSFPLCLIFGITPADPRFTSRWVANPNLRGALTRQNKRPCPAALQEALQNNLLQIK